MIKTPFCPKRSKASEQICENSEDITPLLRREC